MVISAKAPEAAGLTTSGIGLSVPRAIELVKTEAWTACYVLGTLSFNREDRRGVGPFDLPVSGFATSSSPFLALRL